MAGMVFVVALLVLVIVPRREQQAAERLPAIAERIDTTPLLAREGMLRTRLRAATGQLDSTRHALAAADSADSVAATRPRQHNPLASADSVQALARELTRLLARAERAPLPASYRDLAGARAVAGDPRVEAWLDSLGRVERAQRAYGSVGGVDAGYVSLSERANAIGAALAALARQRRAQLRGDDPSDTLRRRAELDTLQRELDATARGLAQARAANARVAAAVEAARERANIDAPPLAMLGAALALGLTIGGAVSLGVELASPRVASARDAAAAAGVPVMGQLDDDRGSVERLARRVAGDGAARLPVVICAETPLAAARVAVAIATASAVEGLAVLLVDTDTASAAASGLLRRRPAPGASDVIARGAAWSGVLDAHVGSHSLPLDLVAAGPPMPRAPDTITVEEAGRALRAFAADYDLAIVCVSLVDRPIVDVLLAAAGARQVLLCPVRGETTLTALRRERDRWRGLGTAATGVVLLHGERTGGPWSASPRAAAGD
ncbi:MAG: hypothetical protein HYX65_02195 [Gemmatimonadetes bacterium]|nr:hypothetical protein [Gemmatimonadota bacterium]